MLQKVKENITKNNEVFTLIPCSRKMLFLKNVGRLCKCGCNEVVIGPTHKKYYSTKCRDHHKYLKRGRQPSRQTIQALVGINVNYDGTRNISLYFKKGIKKDIRIGRNNCIELWDTLNQISEFRNRES